MRSRFFLLLGICILGFCSLTSPPCYGRQEDLDLPVWIDMGIRFTQPPFPDMDTSVLVELKLINGEDVKGDVSITLPESLTLVEGKLLSTVILKKHLRQRIALTVRPGKGLGREKIHASFSGPYPVNSMIRIVQGKDLSAITENRKLSLIRSLEGIRTVSFAKNVFISDDEISVDDSDIIWSQVFQAKNGRFLTAPFPDGEDTNVLKARIRKFEHFERILKKRKDYSEFIKKIEQDRLQKIYDYGRDLLSLASSYVKSGDNSARQIKKLLDKSLKYRKEDRSTVLALRNLLAIALVKSDQQRAAVRIWGSLGESTISGTLRAYMLYNAGEALRIGNEPHKAVEFYKAALSLRPGLILARERIRLL